MIRTIIKYEIQPHAFYAPEILNHKCEGQFFVKDAKTGGGLVQVVQYGARKFQIIETEFGNRVMDDYSKDTNKYYPVTVEITVRS